MIKSFPESPNPRNRIKGYQKRISGTQIKEAVKNEFKKGKKNCKLTSVQTAVYCAAYCAAYYKNKLKKKKKYIYTNSGENLVNHECGEYGDILARFSDYLFSKIAQPQKIK